MPKIICLNKPFQVLSQFTDKDGRACLSDYIHYKGFYPAGRLDYDSEGLLLLTNDGKLQHQISSPHNKMQKKYWVQIEGEPEDSQLRPLRMGIELKDGTTKPARVTLLTEPKTWDRRPAIRFRKDKPTSWLEITLTEGKNRQVRRMTAAIGYPTLRLIRHSIGPWQLNTLKPGEWSLLDTSPPKESPAKKSRKHTERKKQSTDRLN